MEKERKDREALEAMEREVAAANAAARAAKAQADAAAAKASADVIFYN